MVPKLHAVGWYVLEVGLVACVAVYTALVSIGYRHYQEAGYSPRLSLSDPARSAQRLFVWLGVKAVAGLVHVSRSAFEVLCDASADVGDWVISKADPDLREKVRSKFL